MQSPSRQGHHRRGGFTLVELLVAIGVIGILMALLLPAVQQSREAARRTQCRSHLHQLAIAVHNYESTHQSYPIGSLTVGPSFRTHSGWGWGAMLLPHLDQAALHRTIDFDVGTTVNANRLVIALTFPTWVCPSDSAASSILVDLSGGDLAEVATGNYCGVESIFRPMRSFRPRDVTDGLSQTLIVGERVNQSPVGGGRPYTSAWCGRIATRTQTLPDAIPHLPTLAGSTPSSNKSYPNSFSSDHPGGAHFALGDGAVRMLSTSIDGELYEALGTRSGNEVVEF